MHFRHTLIVEARGLIGGEVDETFEGIELIGLASAVCIKFMESSTPAHLGLHLFGEDVDEVFDEVIVGHLLCKLGPHLLPFPDVNPTVVNRSYT